MKVIRSVREMQRTAEKLRQKNQTIALVPTMGYLHEGHLSLIRLARKKADKLIVSIFVNPTQFGPGEDFKKYPRNLKRDEQLCRSEKADIIFYPEASEIYGKFHKTYIITEELAQKLCGISRPTHFRGVTTIVAKLFNITKPDIAVFGQKDAQQALILKRMVDDLNFDIEILLSPIIREADGLAISSRNKYLDLEERGAALILYKSLQEARQMIEKGQDLSSEIIISMQEILSSEPRVRVDYIGVVRYDTLENVTRIRDNTLIAVAAYIGKTRLIDNILIGRQ